MSSGRVHTLAVATRPGGQVVYERFYDAFSEAEKGEVRCPCRRRQTRAPAAPLLCLLELPDHLPLRCHPPRRAARTPHNLMGLHSCILPPQIRSAFDAVAGPSGGKGAPDDEELVGRYRSGCCTQCKLA